MRDRVPVTSLPQRREEPASVQWLAVLRAALPPLERSEQTPEIEAAIDRVRRSITLLEEYVVGDLKTNPWQYLEYYGHGCLFRLQWTGAWADLIPPTKLPGGERRW